MHRNNYSDSVRLSALSLNLQYHQRAFLHSNIDHVQVKVVIELQGKEHADKVKQVLLEHGYDPIWDQGQPLIG